MAASGWDLFVRLADTRELPEEDLAVVLRCLRTELLGLDIAAVETLAPDTVPAGAKGASAIAGTLAVRLGVAGLKAVLTRAREWVSRNGRSVEITLDGDTLKLTNVTTEQQSKLIEAWLARHGAEV